MRLARLCAAALLGPMALLATSALARDDGRYANSPLKPWFESLHSQYGQCCSDADGYVIADVDWESDRGHYRVRIDDEWVVVPDGAVITEPNKIRSNHGVEALCRRPSARALLHARQHDVAVVARICTSRCRAPCGRFRESSRRAPGTW
ncbi:hypothetical protein ACVW0J_004474 [Bradyrhizobium sp. i1.7.7]